MALEELEAAWAARDDAALAAGGAEIGIELTLAKLDVLVGAGGPRPTRQILAALVDAATSEAGIAVRSWHGQILWTCVLALPTTHPLRVVSFRDYESAELKARFT